MSKVITLVRYNQWFIPADTESYNDLRSIGLLSTQIHEDMIELVKLQCSKKGFLLKGRHFKKVMAEFEERITDFWEKQHRTMVKNPGRWIFRANKTAYTKAKAKSVGLLENRLRKFFERWGMDAEFTFSENAGSSLKLVVDFRRRTRVPIIPVTDVHEDQEIALTLGNFRLALSKDRRFVYFKFQTKCGDEWSTVTSGRSRHEDVSDPTLFIGELIASYSITSGPFPTDLAPFGFLEAKAKAAAEELQAAKAAAEAEEAPPEVKTKRVRLDKLKGEA